MPAAACCCHQQQHCGPAAPPPRPARRHTHSHHATWAIASSSARLVRGNGSVAVQWVTTLNCSQHSHYIVFEIETNLARQALKINALKQQTQLSDFACAVDTGFPSTTLLCTWCCTSFMQATAHLLKGVRDFMIRMVWETYPTFLGPSLHSPYPSHACTLSCQTSDNACSTLIKCRCRILLRSCFSSHSLLPARDLRQCHEEVQGPVPPLDVQWPDTAAGMEKHSRQPGGCHGVYCKLVTLASPANAS